MQKIINIILSVILVINFLIGGLFVVVGVQCLNSTTPTTAILSIGAGLMLLAVSLWCFPFIHLMDWWKKYTDRMTKEGQHFPVFKSGYGEEVKTYTQDELDTILDKMHKQHVDEMCDLNLKAERWIEDAKDEVANYWSKECIRLATLLAEERKYAELAKREKTNADFWKSMYEGMKSLNASVEKRADLAQNNELRAQRKLTISAIKVEMAEMRLDLVKQEVGAKIQKEFDRINDLLKDASIKVDGNCPEQRASFVSIVKCARSIMDGCHIMWIKNHI